MRRISFFKRKRSFSLIELVIGLGVFSILSVSVYQVIAGFTQALEAARIRTNVSALAEEQFEIIRNLPYSDVGVSGGSPSGILTRTQTITRQGIDFSVRTSVKNVDDPFDGTVGGNPNDLAPADYKLVELKITCAKCLTSTTLTTNVAPLGLEANSSNGSLFVHVFDANGQPIEDASVHVENNQQSPAIVLDEETNANGEVQLVDIVPGVEAYEISVSKNNYSTAQTYTPGDPSNPNPTLPHATVAAQTLTEISFAIDKFSTMNVSSLTATCSAVPNVDFHLQGSKLIGVSPDIYVYNQDVSTNASGVSTIPQLVWDTYTFTLQDQTHSLAGTIPILPLSLSPNTTQDVDLVLASPSPDSVLFQVIDSGTQLPLSDASILMTSDTSSQTLLTGHGYLRQTDWSGGSGQIDFNNVLQYFADDGNIDTQAPTGELRLRSVFGLYFPSGELTSSTFDTGGASNFSQIQWIPEDQPVEVGANSIRFQIATNSDQATWNFLGPDGTAATYYTLSNTNVNSIHLGDRYLRYKVFLQTADAKFTPNLAEVAVTYTSSCIPPGQSYFSGLSSGSYTYTVTRSGYQSVSDTLDVSQDWQSKQIRLTPQ